MQMKTNKPKRSHNKGVTLIEVLVATVILALLSIPLLSAFVATTRINAKSRERQETTSMSQDLMEEIKAESLANIYVKVTEAVDTNSPLVLGGKTIEVDNISVYSAVKSSDDKFVDTYKYVFTDVDGYDVYITAQRGTEYAGYSDFGDYQLPQNFKYNIDIQVKKTGETEVFSTITGTTLELVMVTYDEAETE